METRRNNHKMTLFYKMVKNCAPLYISSVVPQSVSNVSRYNLRNSNDLQTLDARTNQYYMYTSFLPSSGRAWNDLSDEAKRCESVNSFKHYLQKDKSKVPKHFYSGCRKKSNTINPLTD